MWDRLALLPLAFQSIVCPSRTSDTVLLIILSWVAGFFAGGCIAALSIAALILSPGLRRCLIRATAFALQEAVPEGLPRSDRLQRYRQ